jgi:hypothetical protein
MKSMIPAVFVIAAISGQESHAGSCATTIRGPRMNLALRRFFILLAKPRAL